MLWEVPRYVTMQRMWQYGTSVLCWSDETRNLVRAASICVPPVLLEVLKHYYSSTGWNRPNLLTPKRRSLPCSCMTICWGDTEQSGWFYCSRQLERSAFEGESRGGKEAHCHAKSRRRFCNMQGSCWRSCTEWRVRVQTWTLNQCRWYYCHYLIHLIASNNHLLPHSQKMIMKQVVYSCSWK